ncbi:hypothetical protein BAU15_11310 [Enterococcus sp. JM4C]|uniref:sensor histidine kinase n=1 Tax=Candidatus Enterococcus huntleyi TaxID=1857217 RepID=UPI00137A0DB1|nr:sensor histidine kinase [Enterococcus sp. JM4C]KAF1297331.1 hypothetical protein BAU15_11310 [Enterococcus sp. JM4C]
MKNKRSFIFRLLRDYLWQLLLYFVVIGLVAVTFYLHNLSWAIYQDAILFSFPIVLILFVVKVTIDWQKHKKIQRLIQKSWQVESLDELTQSTLLEQDYYQLLTNITKEMSQITYQKESQQKELIDYYAMWSHQIKTPLAALDLMVQVEESPRKQEFKNEIFKMEQYLDMMLQYLRIQSPENDFVFKEVSLAQVVKPIIKKYAPFFIAKDLGIELEIDEVRLVTDEKWLSFILEQIIFNGIKYTKTGQITIKSDGPQSFVICDTGLGILEEDIPRIFEKGYTGLNGRGNKKATGLGLYMSKVIADKLEIQLTVTSTVGQGTQVKFQWQQSES